MKYLEYYSRYCLALNEKLQKGFKDYGDTSFSRNPEQLIQEIQAECLDISGWGLVLWARLEKMLEVIRSLPGQTIQPSDKDKFIGRSDTLDEHFDKEVDKAMEGK